MFRRAGPDRCQVCGRRFAAAGSRARHEQPDTLVEVYRKVGDCSYRSRVCERCWLRHEKHAAETRRRFVRDNPPEPLLATVRNRRADEAGRIAAMRTLVELGDPRTVPALCQQLQDPSQNVRQEAAKSLGRTKDRNAVVPLCRRLEQALAEKDMSPFEEPATLMSVLADLGDRGAAESMSMVLLDTRAYHTETFVIDMDIKASADMFAPALERLGGLDLVFEAYARVLRSANPLLRRYGAEDLSVIAWRRGTGHGPRGLSDRHRDALQRLLRLATQDEVSHVRFWGQQGLQDLDRQ